MPPASFFLHSKTQRPGSADSSSPDAKTTWNPITRLSQRFQVFWSACEKRGCGGRTANRCGVTTRRSYPVQCHIMPVPAGAALVPERWLGVE